MEKQEEQKKEPEEESGTTTRPLGLDCDSSTDWKMKKKEQEHTNGIKTTDQNFNINKWKMHDSVNQDVSGAKILNTI